MEIILSARNFYKAEKSLDVQKCLKCPLSKRFSDQYFIFSNIEGE